MMVAGLVDEPYTFRRFLITRAFEVQMLADMKTAGGPYSARGVTNLFLTVEAVSSTMLEHPEWPEADEKRTWRQWKEWEKSDG